ncbi:hypothetical protein MYCFIDRAFT_33406 [Lecanosticta acicola]|uniref:RecQ mediated genome instability protein 1-like N-terminal helical domain-containing protein n=1 Tax=Lecanosticta acicola TaxID=111012 RepID=A0AAI8Z429_9PEZI|nr:hypothetical protein MYCFIDRAFT_33406 [Lecanosticta acicola]
MSAHNGLSAQISAHLATKSLHPTPQWLSSLIPTIRANTPLPALQRTAEFRLLSTDITSTLQSSSSSTFSAGISDPNVKDLRIPGPVPVQVLDIEDVGRSRWSQVEAMEMEERGETRKGHEVIRVVAEDDQDNSDSNPPAATGGGPHKLLVQDAKGTKVYAFELENVEGVSVGGLAIGAKMVLKDITVSRGVVLLRARGAQVLGGKVDAWDKKWREERKAKLKEKAGWRDDGNG